MAEAILRYLEYGLHREYIWVLSKIIFDSIYSGMAVGCNLQPLIAGIAITSSTSVS